MPPESVPWDRKDFFFKERKRERSDSPVSVGRWRESSYYGSREFSRWGSASRRRPPCHGKQDGWHFFSEESGHGYGPPRSSIDRMLENESCRPSASRGEGKYHRSGRESRGGSNQRDWRGHPWETNCGTTSSWGRSPHSVNDNRAADDAIPYSYHPQTNFVQTGEQIYLKDQRDKNDDINGLGITLRCERDRSSSSINWKPLKHTRYGSLSTRGSGLSHLSDSKSIEEIDSNERKFESLPKNATPDHILSGDVVVSVTSAPSSEEEFSNKKPRLGWGEGLAKYEKKKVEPDICLYKEGHDFSGTVEMNHTIGSSFAEKSPRIFGCASPAPSSEACTFSPGLEGKSSSLTVNANNENGNLCSSPTPVFMTLLGVLSHSLDKLEIKSISNMGTLLMELLHSDYSNSVYSSSIAMDKLLICRSEISKELEITESEIDHLECEIKSLKSENGYENFSKEFSVSSFVPGPAPLEIACDKVSVADKIPACYFEPEEVHDMKDKDIDSTSNCFKPCTIVEADSHLAGVNFEIKADSSGNLDSNQASYMKKISTTASSENMDYVFYNSDHHPINNKMPSNVTHDGGLNVPGAFLDLILATNKELACDASKEFNKLLPVTCCKSNIWDDMVSCAPSDPLVEEKFSQRKRFLRFKDRALVIKFQVLKHLWKKDFQMLSTRKSQLKSKRKIESTFRAIHDVCQKSRSSIRPCFSSADYLSIVPIVDIINHTSKLLSHSPVMLQRNILKMPALILNEKEKSMSKLISQNGLVEDPCAFEKERGMINPWTSDEKQIFLDQLATHGKDFRKIASFLSHKTTADCIEFYYKNHKSDSFKKMRGAKQAKSYTNTYLLTTGKKWNPEICTALLDMLGAASIIASHGDGNIRNQPRFSGKSVIGSYIQPNIGKGNNDVKENTSCVDFIVNERETAAADVLAGICGSLSSEAMSSCVTSPVIRQPLMPNSDCYVDDDTSDESCEEMDPSDWTDEEKSSFILAVSSYGKDFTLVSRCVGTKSRDQCKVFFSKVRKCLELDSARVPGNHATSGSDGANGGGSDFEDGCILANDTTICHDNSSSKLTKDVSLGFNIKREDEESADSEIHILENVSMKAQKSSLLKMDCKDNEEEDAVLLSDSGQKSRSHFSSMEDFDLVKPTYNKMGTVHEQKISVKAANVNCTVRDLVTGARVPDSVSIGGENYHYQLNADEITGEKGVVLGNESRQDQKKSNSRDDSQNNLQCVAEDAGESASHLATDQISSTLDREFSQQVPLEFDSSERSFIISFTQEDSLAVAKTCQKLTITKGNRLSSSPYLYEGVNGQGLVDIENGHLIDGQQGRLLPSHESSHIRVRYPLHAPDKKDINCMKAPEGQIQAEWDQVGDYQNLAEGSCLRGHSIVKSRCLGSEIPLISPKSDHEKTSSDSGIPCRHGNVKLFGKILSNLSSDQRSSCRSYEKDQKSQFSKFTDKSFNLNFSEHNPDEKMSFLNFDANRRLELENVPLRSHGFWNGNRIQTGFTSLSDPGVLLAKYPAACGTYSMPLTKTEKQPFQAIPCGNFNGVSTFPMHGDNRSRMVQYPSFRSQDGSQDGVEMQPFTVEAKYRQDMLSYIQRGKGFDAIPFPILQQQQQQQRMGLAGGPGNGVSDPVAAIKMHYARTAGQFGGQSGSLTRET